MITAREMNPLTTWASRRIGAGLSRENIEKYQLDKLRETLLYVKERSRFYRGRFADLAFEGDTIHELLSGLPFCGPEDLRSGYRDFLCVSQSEIARVMTAAWLETSGTTGRAKRLFFSKDELETTADFFDYGMRSIARRGGRTMIFMRGENVPDGVCGLLTRGLSRFSCEAIAYGFVQDPEHALRALLESGADCAVGVASQMAEIAGLPGEQPRLKSLLLAADNIPDETVQLLKKAWSCEVFMHYGMTETCFSGAVDCPEHSGMHICEPDLLLEIIDPVTGERLPEGMRGEIAITTLTRRAMPLVRYRTGDFSQILTGDCKCGCGLKRLDAVQGHMKLDNFRNTTII